MTKPLLVISIYQAAVDLTVNGLK
ncbi:hypothetical protein CCACVL1_06065 [Corchorus capsularis]|uniref:Uncharacterized protein n=1 Tax=Corchorus capsularis TaxID=210143 RepID=A0A1R3JHK2_COCAP|nr:hypothetical protein CCACVL1_06065 [Corchorus capsularis]